MAGRSYVLSCLADDIAVVTVEQQRDSDWNRCSNRCSSFNTEPFSLKKLHVLNTFP